LTLVPPSFHNDFDWIFEMTRPRIAILGRLADGTTVTRSRGLVTARALAEAVWAAGGEPLTFLPVESSDWNERLVGIDGVLMPGGGDIDPTRYAPEATTDEIYGVDALQDEVDFELARWALANGVPLLAICRGCQLVNVALGGTLVQHMVDDHRHKVHLVKVDAPEELGLSDSTVESSCYHHQEIDKLGEGIEVIARGEDGVVEAIRIPSKAWAYGVQWHPEDNFASNRQQLEVFEKFVAEAASFSSRRQR
jgi:putative glutamine amidotransferase